MQRLQGQVGVRRLSPVAAALIVVAVLALIALLFVVAVVAIPVAIVAGLGFAGYRALRGAAKAKVQEISGRDDDGRQNVRVLRRAPERVSQQP